MLGRFDTILWDIDGTLLDFAASEVVSIRQCLANQGETATEQEIEKYKEINHGYWKRFELGQISADDLYTARFDDWFRLMGKTNLDSRKMNDDYQIALGNNPVIWEDTLAVLEELSHYCKQYAVTNGSNVAQAGKLNVTGIGKYMEEVFISEKVGYQKPDKRFFDEVEKRIPNFSKISTVIVGDSLSSDIKGGNNAGLTCIWFNPYEKTADLDLKIDASVKSLSEIKEVLKQI